MGGITALFLFYSKLKFNISSFRGFLSPDRVIVVEDSWT